ncbi:hypothetical protein [Rothia sp. ZJ932]|uniref:hypothetical protein n=1 Tax=Rothia sp. ZJ932 TaxID=2810516 RepID=UPI001967F46D|nr:hypothetical protein [Rothia sp. ZJ932]QRZ60971.1 hypothetical protein JR346_06805 [Rothia sp. ZJ932]
MSAQAQRKRTKTAREIANRFGISERTVRTMIAEPRDQYLARAKYKRKQAAELRTQRLSIRKIAEKIGVSKSSTGRYVQEYEKRSN